LFLLERFVDRAAPRLVIFALECGGRRDLEVFDEFMHRLLEAGRAARREFDRDRLVRLGEIVDVDPVGRAGARSRVLRQHGLDRLLHADAVRADDEEVEALLVDFRAKPHRLEGARLPDQPVDRLQLRGRGEGQAREIASAIQLIRRQGPNARAGDSERVVHYHPSSFGAAFRRTVAASLTRVKAAAANRRSFFPFALLYKTFARRIAALWGISA